MPDPLVTVTAYSAPADARVAQGTLDSAGIESLVDDSLERRVKVRVQNVDAIRAGDILTARCPPLSEIDEPDEDEGQQLCLACGSAEIAPSGRARMFLLIVVMAVAMGVATGMSHAAFVAISISAVVLLISGRWRCTHCGETWD
ncbi:MAG: hypothetical protein ABI779_00895 [Acidobacteriota bacterium]